MADPFEGLVFHHGPTHTLQAGLAERWLKIRAGFTRHIRAVQHARMMSVLSQMSPQQLADIGITRAEIPRHAAELVGIDLDTP